MSRHFEGHGDDDKDCGGDDVVDGDLDEDAADDDDDDDDYTCALRVAQLLMVALVKSHR